MGLFGQSFNAWDINQFVVRDGDANAPGQFQHGEFILGNGPVEGGRQLDDPRSSHAIHRNGQAAGSFHDS